MLNTALNKLDVAPQTVLITGGAGYIGSHCVAHLKAHGHRVVILDDFSTGFSHLIQADDWVEGNTQDPAVVLQVLQDFSVDAVMHFAAHCYVGESVQDPAKYYANNVNGSLRLFQTMVAAGVKRLVFSSTCAIFGDPDYLPLDEAHPQRPINPYGATKQMVERMLQDFDVAYGLKSVCLRYFNAAGAHPTLPIGECHQPETHLIPLALDVALGKRSHLDIFGNDYSTPDGTCIRDYVHIMDIAEAHRLALAYLSAEGDSEHYNIGTETGHSVKEVIAACQRVSGRSIEVRMGPRRPGDPPSLVASAQKIRHHLGWQPRYPNLEETIQTAWQWALKNHQTTGYQSSTSSC